MDEQKKGWTVPEIKTFALFVITALAEIVGCYLPYLWLREGKSVWLLVPAALSLALFAWLLSLHPTAAGRVYAAYGGVYIFMAIFWLWAVDGIRPTAWDLLGFRCGPVRDGHHHVCASRLIEPSPFSFLPFPSMFIFPPGYLLRCWWGPMWR